MSDAVTAKAQKAQDGPKSFERRNHLRDMEAKVQKAWADARVFEVDAPEDYADSKQPKEKYLVTFPYPYMNGVLHLGHAFTLSKAEFAARYQRLRGKRVLFPFGFHCTGMPIAACADKLKAEAQRYGCPPVFPEEVVEEADDDAAAGGADAAADSKDAKENKEAKEAPKDKAKKKKGKDAKKKSGQRFQWNIMREMGVPDAEIEKFRDPVHWLRYFPPIGKTDLQSFGLATDFRRSFITTDVNPYYDSFIRWQFNRLKEAGKIKFGKRLAIFSPSNQQPCADHDRQTGEGVGPQEYTLIKLEVLKPFPAPLRQLEQANKRVFLVAATLRPETMYGQTNCWVLPEGDYSAFQMLNGDVFVCTARSAMNMSYQDMMSPDQHGKPKALASLKGADLIGAAVSAPLAQYPKVYVLPLLTISMTKGTGIVTSVPSDAPDDWAALMDVKNKDALRAKYKITDDMVKPFEVVHIIELPGVGTAPAEKLCIARKVKSQNDRVVLDQIKQEVYMDGFYKGIFVMGPHKGKKVSEAKPIIRQEMLAAGQAVTYSEPESVVIARSGEECVVALCDQWYLTYGEDHWQSQVKNHMDHTLVTYNETAKQMFLNTVGWLKEWACSRTYGLGTRLPWNTDTEWIIESLSDSTIYMAYYAVAHILQGGVLDGSLGDKAPGHIKAEQMTDAVWDYIFKRGAFPKGCTIAEPTLQKMRREFEYWYPLDLRVSGKDLIGNHLTMALYNHAAIWENEPDMWPRSFFTNGHIMVNGEKMSKSLGNFLTLSQAVARFSTDATRLGLADAGDSLNDANFDEEVVNAGILRLTKEEAWIKETMEMVDSLRKGPLISFMDQVFSNDINKAIAKAAEYYEKMQYHEVLRVGFFDLLNARDLYRSAYDEKGMNRGLVERFIDALLLILSPICPHFTQFVWSDILKRPGFIMNAKWPVAEPEDKVVSRKQKYLNDVSAHARALYDKQLKGGGKKAPAVLDSCILYAASSYPDWQQELLDRMREGFHDASKKLEKKDILPFLESKGLKLSKKDQAKIMSFVVFVEKDVSEKGADAFETKMPFDEVAFLNENVDHIFRSMNLKSIKIVRAEDDQTAAAAVIKEKARPGQPEPFYFNSDAAQAGSGSGTIELPVA